MLGRRQMIAVQDPRLQSGKKRRMTRSDSVHDRRHSLINRIDQPRTHTHFRPIHLGKKGSDAHTHFFTVRSASTVNATMYLEHRRSPDP
jgi:hypothetical protein